MPHVSLRRVLMPLAVGLSLTAAPAVLAASAQASTPRASASTAAPTSVTNASAVLTGTVTPNGQATTYRFSYKTGSSALARTAFASAGAGTSPVAVSVTLSGLNPATTYRYGLSAVNSAGTTFGAVVTFATNATASVPPTGPTHPTPPTNPTPPTGPTGTAAPILNPQTTWAPVTSLPTSDSAAAALVTPEPEVRPGNTAANDYVPSAAQLAAFYKSTPGFLNDPLRQYVTGRPGLSNPTTDDLIQWAAHKWGIPEDVIRAEMVVESDWNMTKLGDRTTVSSSWYGLYAPQAQIAGSSDVYQSMGVMQIRWLADNSGVGAGTEPLRWESTAFNLDFYGATVRWLYDGYTAGFSWVPNIYKGQGWTSIGGWYGGGGNTASQNYVKYVQNTLANRTWAKAGF